MQVGALTNDATEDGGRGNRLIVFARYPEPGRAKTRLIPALGPQRAADVQRDMTRHTLRWVGELAKSEGVSMEMRFAGGDVAAMQALFAANGCYRPQAPGDLGERMSAAVEAAFDDGARRVVIVGTD